jgi:hypothetical protein
MLHHSTTMRSRYLKATVLICFAPPPPSHLVLQSRFQQTGDGSVASGVGTSATKRPARARK